MEVSTLSSPDVAIKRVTMTSPTSEDQVTIAKNILSPQFKNARSIDEQASMKQLLSAAFVKCDLSSCDDSRGACRLSGVAAMAAAAAAVAASRARGYHSSRSEIMGSCPDDGDKPH
jgi:hypothetical protein